jgi:phage shock protein PspC (stress-responsive transcriptional regulator)
MWAMHDDPNTTSAATPPPDGIRRLRRGPGGHVGGVAAGLGRYLKLDPNLIRLGFVIASVLAGLGVVAYLAAWLLIPRYDDPTPDVIRLERGPRLVGGAILATVAVVLLTEVGNGHVFGLDRGVGLLFAFALVGVGAYLLTRTPETAPGGPGGPAFAGAPGQAATAAPPRVVEPIVVEPTAPAEPGSTSGLIPRPSWLTPLTLGAITIVAGIMLALDLADVADPDTADYAMAGLIITGLGLVASAFVDRAYWLIPVGLAFASVLAVSLWIPSWWDDGIGQRRYEPVSASELEPSYRLGVGELIVDLTQLPVQPGTTHVQLDLGVGSALVLVPRDVDLDVRAHTDIGETELLGDEGDGSQSLHYDAPGTDATLVIDADVSVGKIEVSHA